VTSEPRTVIGVDLGGTKIEVVVARVGAGPTGPVADIVSRVRTATPHGYDTIVEGLATFVREVAGSTGVALDETPIAVGMPGSITRAGLVKNSNTTCLNGRPFRDDVSRALGRPVAFENDANLFALAETKLGAARSFAEGVVFGVILGTGVGGGIVLRGVPWSGPMGWPASGGTTPSGRAAPTRGLATAGTAGASRRTSRGPRSRRSTVRAPATTSPRRPSSRDATTMRTLRRSSTRCSTRSRVASRT
jgi:predicted NBD/HSP70 family sugar kinase